MNDIGGQGGIVHMATVVLQSLPFLVVKVYRCMTLVVVVVVTVVVLVVTRSIVHGLQSAVTALVVFQRAGAHFWVPFTRLALTQAHKFGGFREEDEGILERSLLSLL